MPKSLERKLIFIGVIEVNTDEPEIQVIDVNSSSYFLAIPSLFFDVPSLHEGMEGMATANCFGMPRSKGAETWAG